MKKILAVVLSTIMVLSLFGCATTDNESVDKKEETGDQKASENTGTDEIFEIGLVQLVEHDALDAATQGFIDTVTKALGDKVNVAVQNAQGDTNTCSTIVNGFVSSEVDLIMANATPALQAAQAGTTTIPVLGTSVTEYGVALGIDGFTGTVGGNISGTSDLAPLNEQASMLHTWFPDAKAVGLLYCSAEANSQYQVDVVKAELETLGYTCELYPFTDSNDLASVTTTAIDTSDVIYVPTDNTVASNTGIIDNICRPAGIPVIAGEEGIASGCGVATLSIDYYDLGVATGNMAVKILTEESQVEDMPIEYAPEFTPKFNADICKDLELTAPEGYVAIGE